jgi:hypothetical protein
MSTSYLIPIANPPQRFSITLSGVTYTMTVMWRDAVQGWFLDIADALGNPIVGGIPFVTGADLLAQYATLGIPGQLIVATNHDVDAVPTYDNLGTLCNLYYIAP